MGVISISPIPGEALISSILTIGTSIIDRLFPDPTAAAAAKLELLKMQQAGEFKQIDADVQLAVAQMQTNTAEAQSGSAYAAGWRPSIGYICAAALGWNFIGYPVTGYVLAVMKIAYAAPPMLDTGPLLTLVLGMLGLGTMRSFEKAKGVSS
jgi:hypothetical protein